MPRACAWPFDVGGHDVVPFCMSVPEDPWWRAFIAASPARTAKLATTRANGAPHVTPVWVDLDGDQLVFTTHETGLKGKAVRRDPRVALCLDDDSPPFSYVLVEGTAEVITDPAELLHWATRIGGRYMGAENAEAFGRRNGVPGELLVRVTPTKVSVYRDVAD